MKKKKMQPLKFNLILSVILSILVIISILLTYLTDYYRQAVNQLLGSGKVSVSQAEGTENWDADYYGISDMSIDDVESEAKALTEEICEEGFVLLKNKDNTLPLQDDNKNISAFGWSFYHPIYGGSGAGAVDTSVAVSPEQALENAGYTLNEDVKNSYNQWSEENGFTERPGAVVGENASCSFEIPEMQIGTEAQTAAENSDTAIVWIGRQGSEGYDLPMSMNEDCAGLKEGSYGYNPDKHYLELTDEEENLIDQVGSSFEHVIVCINSSNVMELGELEDNENVDAILWVGGGGETGFNALGGILDGEVNPSGKLADIYPEDLLGTPEAVNFSDPEYNTDHAQTNKYTNVTLDNADTYAYFVQYEEGIYVGYRYYETADAEAKAGNYEGFDYDEQVVYPFGYGLSYTTFHQEITDFTTDDDTINVEVKVTNEGETAGKDVVQLYYTPPYTSGDVEKSEVNLVAYEKTELIEPGESQTIQLSFSVEEMASYDASEAKAYILDAGDYEISLRTDSHHVVDSKTYTLKDKKIFDEEHDGKRSSDQTVATNAFDDNMEGISTDFQVMSRSDFAGTFPKTATDEDRTASKELLKYLQTYDIETDIEKSDEVEMPVTGENNGIQLINMRGLDYDDEEWEEYLDQFTVEEMAELVAKGGFGTAAIEDQGVPSTACNDGPSSLKTAGLGTEATSKTLTGFPSEVVLASTWNKELAHKLGETVGKEGALSDVTGWYAPGLNTHRTAFGGRNFEYFSEDGVLAGNMAAEEVAGAADYGVFAMVKHFAMNEQESYRNSQSVGGMKIKGMDFKTFTPGEDVVLLTWADEQTIREIYLKPFELCVKNAKTEIKYIGDEEGNLETKEINACTGIMTSFNYIGNTWAGGESSLLKTVLRDEWGFSGITITDANFFTYMNMEQAVMNGGTLNLSTTSLDLTENKDSAAYVQNLREAAHSVLYSITNSAVMTDVKPGSIVKVSMATWQIAVIAWDIVIGILTVLGIIWMIFRTRNIKKRY